MPAAIVCSAQEAVAIAGAIAAVGEERAERLVADRWEGAAGCLYEEEARGAARAHTLTGRLTPGHKPYSLQTLPDHHEAGMAGCRAFRHSHQVKCSGGSSFLSMLLPTVSSKRTVEVFSNMQGPFLSAPPPPPPPPKC